MHTNLLSNKHAIMSTIIPGANCVGMHFEMFGLKSKQKTNDTRNLFAYYMDVR